MFRHACYLKKAVPTAERKKTVNKVVRHLRRLLKAGKIEFDAIAFMGMSDALVVPTIAARLDKEIIMVRKHGEQPYSHSNHQVEGVDHGMSCRYIIIDDLICSGNTFEVITRNIGNRGKCVGYYLYQQYNNLTANDLQHMEEDGLGKLINKM